MNLPVDSKITQSLDSFIREVEDDFQSPQQSSFQDFMPKVKRDVQSLEEVKDIPLSLSLVEEIWL